MMTRFNLCGTGCRSLVAGLVMACCAMSASPLGAWAETHVEGEAKKKGVAAATAYERAITDLHFLMGAQGHRAVLRVVLEPAVHGFAEMSPDGAIGFLAEHIKSRNGGFDSPVGSFDLDAACLGYLGRTDPQAREVVDRLFREGNRYEAETAWIAIRFMHVEHRRSLLEQWAADWVGSEGSKPEHLDAVRLAEALSLVGDEDSIPVLQRVAEGLAQTPEEINYIEDAIATIKTKAGMDDAAIERAARYADILQEAGSNVTGHHMPDSGIWITATLVQFHRPNIPVDVLISYVDGSEPNASITRVRGAIALLGLRREHKATPILTEYANGDDLDYSTIAQRALLAMDGAAPHE